MRGGAGSDPGDLTPLGVFGHPAEVVAISLFSL